MFSLTLPENLFKWMTNILGYDLISCVCVKVSGIILHLGQTCLKVLGVGIEEFL